VSRTLPLSEVKARFSEVIEEIATTQERITVTRNGRPVAVLMASDDLETLEETLAILSDPEAIRSIEAGRAAVAAGDIVTREDVEGIRDRLRAHTA
jgi:antitoxin YefM